MFNTLYQTLGNCFCMYNQGEFCNSFIRKYKTKTTREKGWAAAQKAAAGHFTDAVMERVKDAGALYNDEANKLAYISILVAIQLAERAVAGDDRCQKEDVMSKVEDVLCRF